MVEGIAHVFKVANSLFDSFLSTRMDPISDPVAVIIWLAEKRKLFHTFTDEVESHYQEEPEQTRFGVINAFTSAAQTLAPLQRIEVERLSGMLLTSSL